MAVVRYEENKALGWVVAALGVVPNIANIKLYRVFDLDFNIEDADVIERAWSIGSNLPDKTSVGGRFGRLSFGVELRGATAADEIPPEGVFLRASGCKEQSYGSTPNIKYIYSFDGDTHPYLSTPAGNLDPTYRVLVWRDGLKTYLVSLVGNVVINFTAGQTPTMKFDMRGKLYGEGDATSATTEASLTEAYVAGSAPIVVQNESFTINSKALVMRMFEYSPNCELDPREDFNGARGYGVPILTNPKPQATLELEAPDLDDLDFEAIWLARTELTVGFVHNNGGSARQQCTVAYRGYLHNMPEYFILNGKQMVRLTIDQSSGTSFSMTWA